MVLLATLGNFSDVYPEVAAGPAVAAAPRPWKISKSRVCGFRGTAGLQAVPFCPC